MSSSGTRHRLQPDDEVFAPADVVQDLSRQTVRGGAAAMATQVARFALRTTSNIALARLLSPRDFGLVAMAAVVTELALLVKDLGLSLSTVQSPRITHREVSTLFWVNVATSVLLGLIVAGAAPLLADFYDEPAVTAITIVMATSFVFSGLSAQHTALLQRQMRFAWVSMIDTIAMAAGVAAAIVVAVLGGRYWAIVALAVVTAFVTMVLSWWRAGWTPGRPGRLGEVREMLAYGANYTGFNILTYLGRQADNALLGWRWGSAPLGLYTRAYALLLLPLKQINNPMTRIAMPVLSRLDDQPAEYRRYYLFALNLVNHITVPLITLLAVLAEPVIVLLLGSQWRDTAPIFTVLAVAAILQPTLFTMTWVTTSTGRTDKQLRWALVSTPILALSFVVGLPWGPIGVSAAYAVAVNAITAPGMAYAFRGTAVTLGDAVRAVARPFASTLICASACLAVRLLVEDRLGNAATVGVALAAAALTFGVLVLVWPGLRNEAVAVLRLRKHLRRGPS